MTSLEETPNKLTDAQAREFVESLRQESQLVRNRVRMVEPTADFDEEERKEVERQIKSGINFGKDYFNPLQVEELAECFHLPVDFISQLDIRDALLLEETFRTKEEMDFSPEAKKLDMSESELKEAAKRLSLKDREESELQNRLDTILTNGLKDSDSNPK